MRSLADERWAEITDRAFNLMTAIENARDRNGRTIAERFPFSGTSLWFLMRDALFERDGGVLDVVARANNPPFFDRQSTISETSSNEALPLVPPIGLFDRRFAQSKTAIESISRTLLGSLHPRSRSNLLVIAPHGAASRRALDPPLDRWSEPYRTVLIGKHSTWVSLFPPTRTGAWSRDLFSDWRAIGSHRYVPWQAGISVFDWLLLAQRRRWFRKQLHSLWNDQAWRASWSDAMPLTGRSDAILEIHSIFQALDRDLGLASLLVKAAEALVEQTRPSIVVTFDTLGNAGRAFTHAAHQANIPTVGIQTGIISSSGISNLGYRLDRADPRAPRPGHLLLWGPHYVEILKSIGWPIESLHSVGFEERKLATTPSRQSGISGTSPRSTIRRILLLANANVGICSAINRPADELRLIEQFIKSINRQSSASRFHVLVRCHPATVGTAYGYDLARLCSESANTDLDSGGVPLSERIAESDIIVGSSSTSLIEAAKAGRPVVLLSPSGIDITGFQQYGIPSIDPTDDIGRRLSQILQDESGLQLARQKLVAHVAPDLDLDAVATMLQHWTGVKPGVSSGTSN